MGRFYKLYTNTTGSNNGVTSVRVTKAARIKCVYFSIAGLAGAATTAQFFVEVSKQNTINHTVNDTPETVIASAAIAYPVSGGSSHLNQAVPCDIPVVPGDTLYLNTALVGATAPANQVINVYLGV
jgi:hypothetical protein